jgi:hypothetical protein
MQQRHEAHHRSQVDREHARHAMMGKDSNCYQHEGAAEPDKLRHSYLNAFTLRYLVGQCFTNISLASYVAKALFSNAERPDLAVWAPSTGFGRTEAAIRSLPNGNPTPTPARNKPPDSQSCSPAASFSPDQRPAPCRCQPMMEGSPAKPVRSDSWSMSNLSWARCPRLVRAHPQPRDRRRNWRRRGSPWHLGDGLQAIGCQSTNPGWFGVWISVPGCSACR